MWGKKAIFISVNNWRPLRVVNRPSFSNCYLNKFFIEYLTRITGYQGVFSISLFRNRDGVIFDTQELAFLGKKITKTASLESKRDADSLMLQRITQMKRRLSFQNLDQKGTQQYYR